MEINGDTIIFKSDDDCYFKEEAGIKPNTVRFVWEKTEIPEMVTFYKELESEVKYIEIHNRRSSHLFFKRQVRDITYFEDRLVWIISWFHEDNGIQTGFNAPIQTGKEKYYKSIRGQKVKIEVK